MEWGATSRVLQYRYTVVRFADDVILTTCEIRYQKNLKGWSQHVWFSAEPQYAEALCEVEADTATRGSVWRFYREPHESLSDRYRYFVRAPVPDTVRKYAGDAHVLYLSSDCDHWPK